MARRAVFRRSKGICGKIRDEIKKNAFRAVIRDKEKKSCTEQEERGARRARGGMGAMGAIPEVMAGTPEAMADTPAHTRRTATATTARPINQAAGGGCHGS